jgi:hypothetical protein
MIAANEVFTISSNQTISGFVARLLYSKKPVASIDGPEKAGKQNQLLRVSSLPQHGNKT